uniref:Integumentary mucin C.1-like n=1 Tax=Actinia tenebrosa TaxID=6105 RepID=A0A6P8HNV0_ACTTE
MKLLLGALIIGVTYFAYVSSLNCWMCRNGAASFDLCDQKKEREDCGAMLRCGTFSYIPKPNASRIFGKSCTTIELCSGNNSFCKYIGEQCRVQCCDTELCNFQKGFAPTSPPLPLTTVITAAPTTKPTTTKPTTTKPTTTKPTTTKPTTTKPTTTEPTTTTPTEKPTVKTKEPTEKPLNPSKDPQSGEDDEDCSWVDGSASSVTNNVFTSRMCLVLLAIFLLVL